MSAVSGYPPAGAALRPWWPALPWLALVLGLWVLAFLTEISAAITTWETSTAYNHCWLVLPVAAWLGWARRHRLAGLAPSPAPVAALPALAAGLGWLVAERLGIMEGRQLAALAVLLAFMPALFGWAVCRAMAAPLLYLVFLVPFGAFLTPVLQDITAWMIVAGLRLFDIPHFADALVIEIPAGVFFVAEACAGLRFIIASLAFGALYALVMFRSPGRRLLVLLLAVIVPVLANGLRALGLVLLGHHWGSAEAAAADHLIYGWVFFSAVILLLTLAGLPFREDGEVPRPVPVPQPPAARRFSPAAALLALAFGLAAPSIVAARGGFDPTPERLARPLAPPEGCQATGAPMLRCGGWLVGAELLVFPPGITWSVVVAERQRATVQGDDVLTFRGPGGWQGRQSPSGETVLVSTWLNGARAGDGLRSRAVQGWNSLLGGQGRPVIAILALRAEPRLTPGETLGPRQLRALAEQMLQGQGEAIERRGVALSNTP